MCSSDLAEGLAVGSHTLTPLPHEQRRDRGASDRSPPATSSEVHSPRASVARSIFAEKAARSLRRTMSSTQGIPRDISWRGRSPEGRGALHQKLRMLRCVSSSRQASSEQMSRGGRGAPAWLGHRISATSASRCSSSRATAQEDRQNASPQPLVPFVSDFERLVGCSMQAVPSPGEEQQQTRRSDQCLSIWSSPIFDYRTDGNRS